jgi:hypothetical protein
VTVGLYTDHTQRYLLLQIATDELGYDLEDYIGELYRMNISCNSSGGGLPESGCLFFKVAVPAQRDQNFSHVTSGRYFLIKISFFIEYL